MTQRGLGVQGLLQVGHARCLIAKNVVASNWLSALACRPHPAPQGSDRPGCRGSNEGKDKSPNWALQPSPY